MSTHPCDPNYDPYAHKRGGPAPAIFGSWAAVDSYLATSDERARACASWKAEQAKEKAYIAGRDATRAELDKVTLARMAEKSRAELAARDAAAAPALAAQLAAGAARRAASEARVEDRHRSMPCGAGQTRDVRTGRCIGSDPDFSDPTVHRADPEPDTYGRASSVAIPGCLMTDLHGECVAYAPGFGPPELQKQDHMSPGEREVYDARAGRTQAERGGAQGALPLMKAAGHGSPSVTPRKLSASAKLTTTRSAAVGFGDFFGGLGDIVTGIIPGTLDDKLWGIVRPGRDEGLVSRTVTPTPTMGSCGPGFSWDGRRCQPAGGVFSAAERLTHTDLPFGTTHGPAVTPAAGPAGVGGGSHAPSFTQRAVCGPGFVLGDDGMCYRKGDIKSSRRANKARRAKVSHSDWKTLLKAESVANKYADVKRRSRKVKTASANAKNKKK